MLTVAPRKSFAAVVVALAMAASPLAQDVRLSWPDGGIGVRMSTLGLIDGVVLDALRDGRAVVVDLELSVLPRARAESMATVRHRFTLSFDLWEERFAVARAGTPARSISHLTSREAETWCLDQLVVPHADLGGVGRDAPIWIRVEYQVQHPSSAPATTGGDGLTLERLIDALSRLRPVTAPRRVIEAGPFRVAR